MSSRERLPGSRPDVVPASIAQRLLWHLGRYLPAGRTLNCPLVCRVSGAVGAADLERAAAVLTRRHEALRTTVVRRGRELVQLVHAGGGPPFAYHDLARSSAPEAEANTALAAELFASIDHTTWPARLTAWRTGPGEHLVLLGVHHLLCDSWSCGVLFRELAWLLGEPAAAGERLAAPPAQYRRFTVQQAEMLAGPGAEEHVAYWRRQLEGMAGPAVPLRARTGLGRSDAVASGDLPAGVAIALAGLAARHQTSAFTVLLALYHLTLHALTGEVDGTVASLYANRRREEFRDTVGCLANMVVLRARLRAGGRFLDVLDATRAATAEAFVHQELPFQMLPPRATPAAAAVGEVVFQMMADQIQQSLRIGDVELTGVVPEVGGRFDFEFCVVPQAGGFRVLAFYAPERLDADWCAALVATYCEAAVAVAADPHLRIGRLPVRRP